MEQAEKDEQSDPVEEVSAVEPEKEEEQEQVVEISDKEFNFKNLRELKDRVEKENVELKKYIASQTQQNQYTKQKTEETEDIADDFGLDDDDLVEGRVVKKLSREIRDIKKIYENEMARAIPHRLKSKFSDFDEVVTPENLNKLKKLEPEVYDSVTSGRDLYTNAFSAYRAITSLGIVEKDKFKSEKEIVALNQSKPLSTQSIKVQGALSDAGLFSKGFTNEHKKQLYKEMQDAIRGG